MPAIDRRVALGRLHVVHHGVDAVGHTMLTRSGRWMAAVLACGPDAALSHASAAALWALQRGEPTIIDVTTRRTGRKRPGIRIHRPRTAAETTTHDGIRVTTPARTILDLAATLFKDLCRAHGLPQPCVNQPVQGKGSVFLSAGPRLIVEIDSGPPHEPRRAFEEDRARDVLTRRRLPHAPLHRPPAHEAPRAG